MNAKLRLFVFWLGCVQMKKFTLSQPFSHESMDPTIKKDLDDFRNTDWNFAVTRQGANRAVDKSHRASCSSPIDKWATKKINEMGADKYNILLDYEVDFIVYVLKRYIDLEAKGEYYGRSGINTAVLLQRQKQLELFWGNSNNNKPLKLTKGAILLGLHGEDLQGSFMLWRALELMYPGYSFLEYAQHANDIQDFVATLPGGYSNPLLSFNAYASHVDGMSDAILYGDGIGVFLTEMGLSHEGPSFVLAHEFGHQLQYEIHMIFDLDKDGTDDPGESLRAELMADAFSSYFLAHPKGGKVKEKDIMKFSKAAYVVGDCAFDDASHHGTSVQRRCAALWGAKQVRTRLLPPHQFQLLFDLNLNKISALDFDFCPGV